jgi:site-specific DNA-adenine methylase
MGSKSKIMPILSKMFPPAYNFYDLFGGGFSVTHYMVENRSRSYKEFHYNEIQSDIVKLVKDVIAGKYSFDVFKPEWIDRERFFKEKDTDAYVRLCWSFGNSGSAYLFGKDIEDKKRSMHQAVIFNEFDQFMIDTFKLSKWPENLSITGRRLYLKKFCSKRVDIEQLERLRQLEQLERLRQLEQRIVFTSKDYREIEIKKNSVIYCDIPYKGTKGYGLEFNHKEFFDWAAKQKEPLFISEYNVDDTRFHLVKEIRHISTLSGTTNNAVKEKLYCNDIAYDIIRAFKK